MGHQHHDQAQYWQGRRPVPLAPLRGLGLLLIIGAVILLPPRPVWGFEFQRPADTGRRGDFSPQAQLGIAFDLASSRDMTGFSTIRAGNRDNPFNCTGKSPASMAVARAVEAQIGGVIGSGGSKGSGGCFITASISELGGLTLLFGFCLITALYGLRLVIRSGKSKNEMK